MESVTIQKTFAELKLLCDRLTTEPNVRIVKILSDNVKDRTSTEIQYYFEYILLPIYIHLHNEKIDKDVKRELIELLRRVLSKTKITKINYFNKLYTALLIQIYDEDGPNMLIASHEELKETTMGCLKNLIDQSSTEVLESLYVRENAPKLSQGVYTCLSIARTEKKISLKIAAIDSLMTLCQVNEEVDPNDVVHQARVADIVMMFLPGIARGLREIALESELQNHNITVKAIKAFGRIITLVMEDQPDEENLTVESILVKENTTPSPDPLGISLESQGDKGMMKHIKTAKRNQEWLNAASQKLNTLIRSLHNLIRHSHFRVRKALLVAVKLILFKCSRNMRSNFTELVEILISLSEDEEKEIRSLARKTLDEINEKFSENFNMRPIVELLEENFYKLLTSLPRLMRRSDSSIQLSYLNQLAGYIRLLGKQRLPRVLSSVSHLRRLLLALIYVAELDTSNVSIFHELQHKDIEDSTYEKLYPWKNFKFINDKSTEEKFIVVCKLLGELGDLTILVDGILDLSNEMPQYRKELILVLNSISTVPVKDSSTLILYKEIIEYYIIPNNWYSPIETSQEVSLRDAQKNIIQCCLLIEGLGNIAENIREEYEKYLLKTLYLVIERAGSGHSFINQAALKTLKQIAFSLNYENVSQLIRENIDYISYHVTIKIRKIEKNPWVLDVFSIVVKYGTIDFLSRLREVVADALPQLSINFHDDRSYFLLKMLLAFTKCVRTLTKDKESLQEEKNIETTNKAEIVIKSVLEYIQAKKDSENIEEDFILSPEEIEKELTDKNVDEFQSPYDYAEEEEKVEPPAYIKMTEDIVKRCLNFLPAKEIAKSLTAMEIMEEGLYVLWNWNEILLPLVHQMWQPLVGRFQESNILIINRAWNLLIAIARVSQDFIRSRTLKEVLPSLSKFLRESSKESYDKDSKNAYKFTQMYKLQKIILTELGTVAKNLKLQERQLWLILDITESYLDSRQHPVLQDSCIQLYKDVTSCNADIVWIKCLAVWHNRVAEIPIGNKLTTVDLKALPKSPNDYEKNVATILTWIEETKQ